ncbi:MAG: hypothetical protein AAF570_16175, partial [Bacteroidota bacterium]
MTKKFLFLTLCMFILNGMPLQSDAQLINLISSAVKKKKEKKRKEALELERKANSLEGKTVKSLEASYALEGE